MPSIFSLSYWFSIRPVSFIPVVEKGLIIAFGFLFVLGIAGFLLMLKHGQSKTKKRIVRRFSNTWVWIGILGAILWSFTYENVVILSMRIFYLPLIIWFLWDFYWLFKYLRVEVPQHEQMVREREQYHKWLPKKKK